VNNTNPTPPYATWATAATSIQGAVDAAAASDAVIVTNGVYSGGLSVTNPLALLSVNGPQFTVINGGGTNSVRLSDQRSEYDRLHPDRWICRRRRCGMVLFLERFSHQLHAELQPRLRCGRRVWMHALQLHANR